jgi:hypothetical protein
MGNIYKDGTAAKYNIPEPVEYGGESTGDVNWVTSNNASAIDAGVLTDHLSFQHKLPSQVAYSQCSAVVVEFMVVRSLGRRSVMDQSLKRVVVVRGVDGANRPYSRYVEWRQRRVRIRRILKGIFYMK